MLSLFSSLMTRRGLPFCQCTVALAGLAAVFAAKKEYDYAPKHVNDVVFVGCFLVDETEPLPDSSGAQPVRA